MNLEKIEFYNKQIKRYIELRPKAIYPERIDYIIKSYKNEIEKLQPTIKDYC